MEDHLSAIKDTVNLREKFPLSIRGVFRRSVSWLLWYVLFVCMVSLAISRFKAAADSPDISNFFWEFSTFTVIAATILVIVKVIYELLAHWCCYYGIEAGSIYVTSGVFLKRRGSIPVDAITDIYIDKDFFDFCFILYDLIIETASAQTSENSHNQPRGVLRIEGLTTPTAIALQDFLHRLMQQTHPQLKKIQEVANDLPTS